MGDVDPLSKGSRRHARALPEKRSKGLYQVAGRFEIPGIRPALPPFAHAKLANGVRLG
jgi:hypothetical protein